MNAPQTQMAVAFSKMQEQTDGVSIPTSTDAAAHSTPISGEDTLRGGRARTILDAGTFRTEAVAALDGDRKLQAVVAKDGQSKVQRIFELFERSTQEVVKQALDTSDVRQQYPNDYAKRRVYVAMSEVNTLWRIWPNGTARDAVQAVELPDYPDSAKYGRVSYKARLQFARAVLKQTALDKRESVIVRDSMSDAERMTPQAVIPDGATADEAKALRTERDLLVLDKAHELADAARAVAAKAKADKQAERETPEAKADAAAKRLLAEHDIDYCFNYATRLLRCVEDAAKRHAEEIRKAA